MNTIANNEHGPYLAAVNAAWATYNEWRATQTDRQLARSVRNHIANLQDNLASHEHNYRRYGLPRWAQAAEQCSTALYAWTVV